MNLLDFILKPIQKLPNWKIFLIVAAFYIVPLLLSPKY